MYRRFHDRFGTAGLVIGVIALVAVLGGSAFAASGGLSGRQKKEVKAIAKSYAGKDGASGANGTNGSNGAPGEKGAPGSPGAPGADGKSVELIESAGGCPEGGTTVQLKGEPATAKEVCNGEAGEEGEPWTPNGTLPKNATETGSWSITADREEFGFPVGFSPISFVIPLAAPLDSDHTIGVSPGQTPPSECENTSHAGAAGPANPEAQSGYLCVYATEGGDLAVTAFKASYAGFLKEETISPEALGADASGALIRTVSEGEVGDLSYGTWAVTG